VAVPTLLAGEMPDASKWANILSFLGFGVVKQATENLPPSTTTLQNDDELRLTFATNSLYEVRAGIIHNSNSTADFKFAFSETSAGGVTGHFDVLALGAGGANLQIFGGALGTAFNDEGAGANRTMLVQGWLNTGANSGDLVVTWAQNFSNASTTQVIAGSWLSLRRLS